MSVTRTALRYHGGKWLLAEWIISHFPPHRVYVEPFGGAASVLLQKPRCYAEVYNDLDEEVVNLFRIVREMPAELARALVWTPFSRDEFLCAYEPCADAVERARRMVIRSFMGFGSASTNRDHRTGFRSNSNRSGTTPARDWVNYPASIRGLARRLRGVVIENKPALELIPQHDTPGTLFYCDPPYVFGTRSLPRGALSPTCYRHEMSDEDHEALAAVLKRVRGGVILSGYHGRLYDRLFKKWPHVEREARADGAARRTEVLWFNEAAWVRRGGALPLFKAGEPA